MDKPNTVRVRIAVAVDQSGEWNAVGGSWRADIDAMEDAAADVDPNPALYWLTAELPIPTVPEVAADVEAGDE